MARYRKERQQMAVERRALGLPQPGYAGRSTGRCAACGAKVLAESLVDRACFGCRMLAEAQRTLRRRRGAKRALAPWIISQLGEHAAYWEPFCGSMAILLAKPPATMETVNDLHGDLVHLARVVQDDVLAPELFARLARTAMCESIQREAAERLRAEPPQPALLSVDRAYYYFLCAWMGRNGMAGTATTNHGFCRRFTRNGGHSATRFVSAVESIPAWWQRLRGVTILSMDAFGLLARIEDAPRTTIYCDPPYLDRSGLYVHDFAAADHVRLAEALARFKRARVVVSYYEHTRLDDLYPGWRVLRKDVTRSAARANPTKKPRDFAATEVLLVNDERTL